MKTTPKDFFLHLGATIALYVAVTALIDLSGNIINYAFPDQLAGYFTSSSIAWPISILIVLVPILYILEWMINRDIAQTPEKKDLWIRKWRIFLTLFLAVILIGGDFIALINTYLNGEITARFVWKVVAILLIAGCAGKYYFYSMYPKWYFSKLGLKMYPWLGIILVILGIVAGFLIVGTPATQRAIRFDGERVSDLQNIEGNITNYWQADRTLPASLADLNDPLRSIVVPVDPETKQAYEYNATTSLSFALCASFDRPSLDTKGKGAYGGYASNMAYPTYPVPPGGMSDVWTHPAGHACFYRTINPNNYPPAPTPKPL